MNVTELRQRAGAALARANEIRSRIEAAEEVSTEDQTALDSALTEASGLLDQVSDFEGRSNRFAELEARAKAPGQRVGAPLMPHTDVNNTRGRHQYSLVRAIQGELAQREGRGSFDGIEREVHDSLAQTRGKAPNGLLVPWDAEVNYRLNPNQIQYRELTTSTGAGAVPLIVRPTMIDVLRAKMVLVGLGATVISDMTQPFALPKTTAAQSGSWVSTEGTRTTPGNPTVGQIAFGYKSVETTTNLTRQFIMGASVDAERYVVDQLTKATALTVEGGAITGSGSSGQPKGLFNFTSGDGINVTALGTNGGAATWANIVAMTGAVNTANAPSDSRAWLFNPATVAYLQSTPKVTGYPTFILDQSDTVVGYKYGSTSLVPSNLTKGTGTGLSALAYGDFSELAIALFSGLDLFIDPYSNQPDVRITMSQYVDVNLLHAQSFAICTDLITS